MNDHLRLVLLCSGFLLLFSPPLQGQDQADRDHRHTHTTFQQINNDYRAGRLSVEQKVLYKLYAVNNPGKLPSQYRQQDSLPIKCGTPAIMEYHNNRDRLSAAANREVQSMMQVSMQSTETHISPSGRFNIQYETTGIHAVPMEDEDGNDVPDYVDEVATAADSSYRHEVLTLGYTDPVFENSDPYPIYIEDMAPYGFTDLGSKRNLTSDTFIAIHNDFEGFPTNDDPEGDQVGSIKVTVAHELKHAIQYAANGWSGETDLWSEMDATLMEEIVYDNVNDYYNYLNDDDSIFLNPQESLYPGSYYDVSWALYFEERYGPYFWPTVWDHIRVNSEISMVNAIREELDDDSFESVFAESQLWHFASGPQNSPPNYGFEEREEYPTASYNYQFFGEDSLNLSLNPNSSISPFSAHFINVEPSPFQGYASVKLSEVSLPNKIGLGIIGYFSDGTTESVILYPDIESYDYQTSWRWEDLSKIGIVITNADEDTEANYKIVVESESIQTVTLEQNYPNPFNPETTIRYSLPEQSEVQLKIYDTTGRLVRTLYNDNLSAGIYEETFDGSNLASGIYFYQLITNEGTIVKKMTLIK